MSGQELTENELPEDTLTAEGGYGARRVFRENWLFDRLPQDINDSLTDIQKEAIRKVIDDPSWSRPPVNIRFSLPLFFRRYYLTLVGGTEQRGPDRRAQERHEYPLRSAANIFFFVGLATLFYVLVILGMAAYRAIIAG
ncbi:MAG: hypothetical protein OEY85_00755 [Rhodospirillales bacterium]|nr:hypothetical protein [Rhodospirillales bacterium]